MTVVFTPAENHALVQIAGPLTQTEAIELRRVIREAGQYWKYAELTLELNSPGGELSALAALMHELKWWRGRGGTVKTQALSFAGSAAAFTLSLGTVGQRMASPHSVLLYHHSRLMEGGQLTAQHAVNTAVQLQMVDRMLLQQLVAHICDGLGGPNALARAGLTRCEHMLARASEIAEEMWPSAGICRKHERGTRTAVVSKLRVVKRAYDEVASKGAVAPFVELLSKEFERDQPMPADLVWALLLIDEVEDVALLKPTYGMAPTENLRLVA